MAPVPDMTELRRLKRNYRLPPGHRYNFVIDRPQSGSNRRMMRKIKRRYHPRRRHTRNYGRKQSLEEEIVSMRKEIQRLLKYI